MRARGISYDTGLVVNGVISDTAPDSELVKRELQIIRDDLRCNAVRIIGGDPERLETAARHAADLGLEIWFSPYPLELTTNEMLALFADCAARAEQLRLGGAEVVFVTGAELSLMDKGFLPGDDIGERLEHLLGGEPDRRRVLISDVSARINAFLADAVALVRERFHGRITYASVPIDRVDWTAFDIISADIYRSAEVADQFRAGIRAFAAQGKPVAITEFGCATYQGAGDHGAQALDIVEFDKDSRAPIRLKDEYVRDEAAQAQYLRDVLEVFDSEGVDSAFVFAFALRDFPHRPDGDPRDDLDLASYGIVKMLEGRGDTYPGMPWEPKAAFAAVADFYSNH